MIIKNIDISHKNAFFKQKYFIEKGDNNIENDKKTTMA
jgi:hypothetical protein